MYETSHRSAPRGGDEALTRTARLPLAALTACIALLVAAAGCSSNAPAQGNACNPDENGTVGGQTVVDLYVSDTAFTVGAVIEGGAGEPNIVSENLANVKLTMTNIGTKPHDFVIECLPTPNTNGCPTQSCFSPSANLPALKPGAHATFSIVTPVHEGRYPFVSDVPGDSRPSADGGFTGLTGAFVVM